MRVTNNMLIINMLGNMNKNLTNMGKYQDQIATGKAIQSPMDDPVGIAKVLKYKTDLSEINQYSRNTSDAMAWLDNTESALIEVNDVYQRLRELAVQAANGTNTEQETQKIMSEVEQLKAHTVSLANSTFAGRYIFSSYHTDEKLMNDDGTYNIDITSFDLEQRSKTVYQIGVGENIEVSSNGLDIFGYEEIVNFSTANMPDGEVYGSAAEPAVISGKVDLEKDYNAAPATPIVIRVNGTDYTVDLSDLRGSSRYPMDKEDVIRAIESATDAGGGALFDSGEVDVYFNDSDELVISTKKHGSGESLSEAGGVLFTSGPGVGTDHVPATIAGSTNVTDADVAAASGNETFLISLNGHTEKITVDMSTLNTTGDLQAALQNSLNAVFPPSATNVSLAVSVTPGGPIAISTVDPEGTDSTKKHVLSVRPVQTTQSTVMKEMDEFIGALQVGDLDAINVFIEKADEHMETLLKERSNIGARVNRMELALNRIEENNVNFTKLLSNVQDADMSEVIMYLKNSENVYRASLQTGARVIQPTLVDFMR